MSNIDKFFESKNFNNKDLVGCIAYSLYKNRKTVSFKNTTLKPKDKNTITQTLTTDDSVAQFRKQAQEILEEYNELLIKEEKEEFIKEIKGNPYNFHILFSGWLVNTISTITIPIVVIGLIWLLGLCLGFSIEDVINYILTKNK